MQINELPATSSPLPNGLWCRLYSVLAPLLSPWLQVTKRKSILNTFVCVTSKQTSVSAHSDIWESIDFMWPPYPSQRSEDIWSASPINTYKAQSVTLRRAFTHRRSQIESHSAFCITMFTCLIRLYVCSYEVSLYLSLCTHYSFPSMSPTRAVQPAV